jgi:hypothetical protein
MTLEVNAMRPCQAHGRHKATTAICCAPNEWNGLPRPRRGRCAQASRSFFSISTDPASSPQACTSAPARACPWPCRHLVHRRAEPHWAARGCSAGPLNRVRSSTPAHRRARLGRYSTCTLVDLSRQASKKIRSGWVWARSTGPLQRCPIAHGGHAPRDLVRTDKVRLVSVGLVARLGEIPLT